MHELIDLAHATEGQPGILTVSVFSGFPLPISLTPG